jgi:16S rRNA pseudouridine516 synthase
MRIDRLLANMGYGSRKEIHALVRAGAVTLDGLSLPAADDRIALTADLPIRMQIDEEPLDPLPGLIVMLHKPLGVSCSRKENGRLVYDLFPERWRDREPPLSTIGRLDKETSGLLLLTDDGDFLHRIISPRNHVSKRYFVTLATSLRGNEKETFASGGLMLEGEEKPLLPVMMEMLSPTTAYVTLMEGRYHQVRRMFAAMKNEVIALHRDRIGGLVLPENLKPGQYQILGQREIDALLSGATPNG